MIPNPNQYSITRLRRVPSACPLTIRFSGQAGRRHAQRRLPPHILLREAAHDLNHYVFTSSPANRVCGGSSSASRSFVLAALRALHLDPDCGPPPQHTGRNEAKQHDNNHGSHLYGDPQHR